MWATGDQNLLIGVCLSLRGQLDKICPHSIPNLRAL
jgi:hypothetical protein